LKELASLEDLNLNQNVKITTQGILQLTSIEDLQHLDIIGYNIDVEEIKKQMPNVKVNHLNDSLSESS